MNNADYTNRSETIAALRKQTRSIAGSERPARAGIISTGCHEMDRLLPENGLRRGTLVEWIGTGSSAACLSLIVARQACAKGGALVVIDPAKTFYAQAASALQIDLNRLIVLRPVNRQDTIWAIDQALRCEAVAAVWGFVEHLQARCFRRLQLSAEAGNTLGLFVRPHSALHQPTWSELSLLIEAQPARGRSPCFRVEVVRCQGSGQGRQGVLEIDELTGLIQVASDETHTLSLDSQLARSKAVERKADIA